MKLRLLTKTKSYWSRLASYIIVAVISAVSSFLINPASVAAQSMDEYFQFSNDTPSLSQNQILGNQVFYVTIHGKAICSKDLPLSVSEASITSRIVARHTASNTVVILNPNYTVAINPFPYQKGNATEMTQTVPLQFPTQAQSGTYVVTAELVEAKIKALFIWIDVTQYLPQSQLVGSIEYTAPQGLGGGGGGGGGGTQLSGFIGIQPIVNFFGYTSGASQLATPDGKLKLNIDGGTRLLNSNLAGLDAFTVAPADSAPQAPASNAIVLAYDLGPQGATFDPFITLTFSYSEGSLAPGVTESSLYVAWWNGSKWESLTTIVDTNANTVSAKISHLSTFALLAPVSTTVASPQRAPVPPLAPPVPAPKPQTVPEAQAKVEPAVTATSPAEQPASEPTPTATSSPTPNSHWWIAVVIILIIGIILGVFTIFKKGYFKARF